MFPFWVDEAGLNRLRHRHSDAIELIRNFHGDRLVQKCLTGSVINASQVYLIPDRKAHLLFMLFSNSQEILA